MGPDAWGQTALANRIRRPDVSGVQHLTDHGGVLYRQPELRTESASTGEGEVPALPQHASEAAIHGEGDPPKPANAATDFPDLD